MAPNAHQVSLLLASKYYQLASVVILFYDYLTTLNLEVATVWNKPKITSANALYFCNRYFPLISYIWILAESHQFSGTVNECRVYQYFPLTMVTISDCFISGIVILRVNALYTGNRSTMILLGIATAILIALDACAAAHVAILDVPLGFGCSLRLKDDSFAYFAALWGWNVAYDFLIFYLTLHRTLRQRIEARKSGFKVPLLSILFKDGIVYFAVMFTVKLINFIFSTVISRDLITMNWTFNHTITVIMISHLFMNIRVEGLKSVHHLESDLLGESSESFAAHDEQRYIELEVLHRRRLDTISEEGE